MNRIYYLLCLIPAFVLVLVFVPKTYEFLEPHSMCGTMPIGYPDAATRIKAPKTPEQARGHELFMMNCARCHNQRLDRNSTGPALYGVAGRIPPGDWIYRYVRDANALVRAGDPYAIQVRAENGNSYKDPMPHLTDKDIDDIMAWIAAYSTEPMPLAVE